MVSGMLLGADRRSGAECSFCVAMPTMAGAFAYDLYKSGAHMSADNIVVVAIGFIASFIAGWIVVKGFLDYVSGHGFDMFAWWRVIIGTLGLVGLALLGQSKRVPTVPAVGATLAVARSPTPSANRATQSGAPTSSRIPAN